MRSAQPDVADRTKWDTLLEKSVVGSFTSFGYRLRSAHWQPIEPKAFDGQVLVITGVTSGIGEEVATRTVKSGARLRFVARNADKADDLKARLLASHPQGDIDYYIADLSSVSEVRSVARRILESEPRIDLLINNAVVLPAERIVTPEGIELSHATNLVAPFALTNALIPRLADSHPARVINIVSGGMYTQGLALDDLNYEQGQYRGSVAYARAKRGLMVLTKLWAERLSGTGVTVNATHPGWVNTPGVKQSLPAFYRLMRPLLRDIEQGTDTILWLATSAEIAGETGKLWHDRSERSEYRMKKTVETASDGLRLWDELARTVAQV